MEITPNNSILALDIGAKRVGIAIASVQARLARPLTTLEQGDDLMERISDLCKEHAVQEVVCGLPRGLDGQETAQTAYTRDFAAQLPSLLHIPVYLIDEAVTSAQAEAELTTRGKPYKKADIDALAATYILEDYLLAGAHAEQVQG